MTAVLHTEGLSRSWGALAAVRQVSFALEGGARHALIGPNGAGKTTFVNLLTGAVPPTGGEVFLGDERITSLPQHLRVKRGIARTFQVSALFPGLTALESVLLAVCERERLGVALLRPAVRRVKEIAEARSLLADLHLSEDAYTPVRSLPYGKQRLLEIALALATRPRILLLDEPAAGIPSGESAEIFAVLSRLPREIAILFIEHDIDLVFRFAERITVMADGAILAEGSREQIAADRRVREVYLGEAPDA